MAGQKENILHALPYCRYTLILMQDETGDKTTDCLEMDERRSEAAVRGEVKVWRRARDSNPHALSDAGFQDRCNSRSASSPQIARSKIGSYHCRELDSTRKLVLSNQKSDTPRLSL